MTKSCKKFYGKALDEMIRKRDLEKKEYRKNYYKLNGERERNNNAKYKKKNQENISQQNKRYNLENAENKAKKQRVYQSENADKRKESYSKYNKNNRESINTKEAERRKQKLNAMTEKKRFDNYNQDIIPGANFVCFSCDRVLFKKQVKILKADQIMKLFHKVGRNFLQNEVGVNESMLEIIFCHDCHMKISKKILPTIHKSNGLELEDVPEELLLKDLEQQLIALVLVFQKIKKLPTSRMHANFDRIITVPIEPEAVRKSVQQLPRQPEDANIVAVQLKRKLELKTTHLQEYIRPKSLVKALQYLKANNVFYQNVNIDEEFEIEDCNSDDKVEETFEEVNVDANNQTGSSSNKEDPSSGSQSQKLDEEISKVPEEKTEKQKDEDFEKMIEELGDELDEDDENILPNVRAFQSKQDDYTCLMPRDLSSKVITNPGKSYIEKETGDGKTNIAIAPGEGRVPTNILKELYFDVKAWPKHHPTGNFGLHHERKLKVTNKMYFNQRFLNRDERFSKDPCYIFMACYLLEKDYLERQINISGQRGKRKLQDGELVMELHDAFDVFKNIKGSPKYWQVARNELVAKVKQLGPFHVFYTFSCGEMRWPEVFLTLLKRNGYKVTIPDKWDGHVQDLLVFDPKDGKDVELWDFVNNRMSQPKHELFKDYTFLITRMFDNRVASFIKNILKGGGREVPFKYYSYRVEFQARGMINFISSF